MSEAEWLTRKSRIDKRLKESGWTLITELRGEGKNTPVIFLTVRDSVRHRVKGLELGADDYLVKPFAFSETFTRTGLENFWSLLKRTLKGTYVKCRTVSFVQILGRTGVSVQRTQRQRCWSIR